MNISKVLKIITANKDLTISQAQQLLTAIMTGKVSNVQISAVLTALNMKGESVSEIVGGASVMRELATKIIIKNTTHLVDTCGTGGDNSNIFNVSTAAAFVVACSGAKVAKHGGRSNYSNSGSADVLELAGVNINMSAAEIKNSIAKIGIGFMFAPNHHSAMKYVINIRKELAIRTIFNLLGPLTNPALAPNQVIGVYKKSLITIFAKALQQLGAKRAMIVHAKDGLDEISIADKTFVSELKDGKIIDYEINPTDFNIKIGNLNNIKVSSAKESLVLVQQALDGKNGEAKDIVAINSGAAIYIAGKAKTLAAGVKQAFAILDSGAAHQKLDEMVRISTNC